MSIQKPITRVPGSRPRPTHRPGFAAVFSGLRERIGAHAPSALPFAIKLALTIGLLITLVMGLLGALLVYNQSRLMGRQIALSGQSMANQLAEAAKEPTLASDRLALDLLTDNLAGSGTVMGAAVIDNYGETLSVAGVMPFQGDEAGPQLAPLLAGTTGEYGWRTRDATAAVEDLVTYAMPLRFEEVVAGHALVTLGRDLMNRSLYDMVRAVAVATVVMVLLGFVLAYFVARRVSRPIMDLVDAGQAMSEGRYQYRIRERRNDEIGNLITAFNGMADGLLAKAQVEDAFSRYVSPSVARNVLANLGEVELGGRHAHGTILFADIVGFTSLSETMTPEAVATLLNEYFSYIARASSVYRGNVDKYIGDCAMIVFGVPEADPEHAFNAVACAALIQAVVARLNQRRQARGEQTVLFRCGLNSGDVLAGNLGSRERMQYTVVGDTVNLASRLCSYADPGRTVISRDLYVHPHVAERIAVHPHRSIKLRGKTEPVAIYQVDGLVDPFRREIEHRADRIISRHLWPVR